jgi:hypothetical protein
MSLSLRPTSTFNTPITTFRARAVSQQRLVVRAQQVESRSAQNGTGTAFLEKEEERQPSPAVNVIQPISRCGARHLGGPHASAPRHAGAGKHAGCPL